MQRQLTVISLMCNLACHRANEHSLNAHLFIRTKYQEGVVRCSELKEEKRSDPGLQTRFSSLCPQTKTSLKSHTWLVRERQFQKVCSVYLKLGYQRKLSRLIERNLSRPIRAVLRERRSDLPFNNLFQVFKLGFLFPRLCLVRPLKDLQLK